MSDGKARRRESANLAVEEAMEEYDVISMDEEPDALALDASC